MPAQPETSVTCTLDFPALPVRSSRHFDCVCCLGPGPDNCFLKTQFTFDRVGDSRKLGGHWPKRLLSLGIEGVQCKASRRDFHGPRTETLRKQPASWPPSSVSSAVGHGPARCASTIDQARRPEHSEFAHLWANRNYPVGPLADRSRLPTGLSVGSHRLRARRAD